MHPIPDETETIQAIQLYMNAGLLRRAKALLAMTISAL
jgi:hypothetical protein